MFADTERTPPRHVEHERDRKERRAVEHALFEARTLSGKSWSDYLAKLDDGLGFWLAD